MYYSNSCAPGGRENTNYRFLHFFVHSVLLLSFADVDTYKWSYAAARPAPPAAIPERESGQQVQYIRLLTCIRLDRKRSWSNKTARFLCTIKGAHCIAWGSMLQRQCFLTQIHSGRMTPNHECSRYCLAQSQLYYRISWENLHSVCWWYIACGQCLAMAGHSGVAPQWGGTRALSHPPASVLAHCWTNTGHSLLSWEFPINTFLYNVIVFS